MLEKNQLHMVTIQGYSSEGAGVARVGGQVVFIRGALDGEACRIKILKAGKTAAFGKVEAVLEASSHRVTPACPVFQKCGGCDLLHMDYTEELAMKRRRVQDAVARIGGLDIKVGEILGAENIHSYRNKAIYAVGVENGRPVIGFYRTRSHQIVPAASCAIQSPAGEKAAGALLTWMNACQVSPYHEADGTGLIRRLFVRHGFETGQTGICIVAAGSRLPKQTELVAALREADPTITSIVLNVNKNRGNTVLQGDFHTLWGEAYVEDILCGLRFRLSPKSFYQVNRAQAERLYEKVMEYADLTGKETVLDLYCGTGTITLCLARRAGLAIGAEISKEAIEDAKENAAWNQIENVRFLCADAGEAAKKLDEEGLRPRVVVVDPPRKGLDAPVVETIAGMEPDRLVYVSCDPATLARDLKRFTEMGYAPERVTPVDMFPRCAHVETVVLLQRQAHKAVL